MNKPCCHCRGPLLLSAPVPAPADQPLQRRLRRNGGNGDIDMMPLCCLHTYRPQPFFEMLHTHAMGFLETHGCYHCYVCGRVAPRDLLVQQFYAGPDVRPFCPRHGPRTQVIEFTPFTDSIIRTFWKCTRPTFDSIGNSVPEIIDCEGLSETEAFYQSNMGVASAASVQHNNVLSSASDHEILLVSDSDIDLTQDAPHGQPVQGPDDDDVLQPVQDEPDYDVLQPVEDEPFDDVQSNSFDEFGSDDDIPPGQPSPAYDSAEFDEVSRHLDMMLAALVEADRSDGLPHC